TAHFPSGTSTWSSARKKPRKSRYACPGPAPKKSSSTSAPRFRTALARAAPFRNCVHVTQDARFASHAAGPPCAFCGLHLREAAIHKQFNSGDVAAVVGRKKHHGFRDLAGFSEPAQRNCA